MIRLFIITTALVLGMIMPQSSWSQCAQVLDGEGFATTTPVWNSCNDGSQTLSIQSSTSWTNLLIDWGDGSPIEGFGEYNSTDTPVEHSYTSGESVYTVTLSEADGSCSLEGQFYASAPASDFWSSSESVCEGTSVQFHQETTGVNYQWNFGVNSNFLNTSTGHVSFTFQNPGTYEVQSVIAYPGTNGACTDTSSIEITVLPKPEIDMTLSATQGCGNLTVSGNVAAANSYLYVWSFLPSPSFQSGMNLDPITFDTAGNHPISVAVTGVNGCQSTAQQIVTVHHQPVADFTFDNACFGETTSFLDASTAHSSTDITGWYWQFGDGGISYESNPEHDYAFTGDYNVSLTVTTPQCSASTSEFVTVNPLPTVSAMADVVSGCSPLDVEFSAEGSLAASFDWTIDGTNVSGQTVNAAIETAIGQSDAHSVSVEVTSAAGCVATDEILITAYASAEAQISPAANAGCAPYGVSIENESQGAIAYEWFADGSFITTNSVWDGVLENTSNTIQSQTIELVAHTVQGCNDTTSTTIQVYPEADFTFDLPNDTACSPLELTMPIMEDVNSFTWNFGGGNTSAEQAPTLLLENTNGGLMGTSITFTGISVFGCLDSHTETVYVRPQPIAEFSSDITSGCEPMVANLENISSDADSYVWNFGDGITDDGSSASHAFSTSGADIETFDITLTAIDDLGCTDSDTLTVTVYPAADLTLELGVESACSPLQLTMPEFPGIQNFTWDFGDGTTSNETNPVHEWNNDSDVSNMFIVSVSAETEFGCGGFAVDLVHVNPQPIASFTASTVSGCEPLEADFLSTSTSATELTWTFEDGTTSSGEAVAHVFETLGVDATEIVTLIATHELGCTDTFTENVEVFAAAEYTLELTADSVCSPLTLVMPSIDGAQNMVWNFGDGTTSTETTPSHTWNNSTGELMSATVSLEAETAMGCAGTSQATVHIKPQPIADFTVNFDEGCEPLVSTFTNLSALADTYDWDFGDGTTDHTLNPTHAFQTNGTTSAFEVTLTAHDNLGCADTATKEVNVFPAAAFTLSLATDTVCSPLELSMPTIPGAQNILWNFGDGSTGVGQNASHVWTNTGDELMTATVSFEAVTSNGCIGSASTAVHIKPQPVADFTVDIAEGCAPLSVQFNNTSTQSDSFAWNFGNGATSGQVNPNQAFTALDATEVFEITLTATHALGCSSTSNREITVFPAAEFTLALTTDSVCSPLELTMPAVPGGENITWDFGDGTNATGQSPTHSWINETGSLMSAVVSFNGETAAGCAGSASAIVHIKPQPVADFTADVLAGCEPLDNAFTNNSVNGDLYIWNFGDELIPGIVNNAPTVEHTFFAGASDAISTFDVTLVAIDELGCSDERTIAVEVSPAPAFELALETTEGCSPLTLTMPEMEGATSTYWVFGDGTMSNEATPTHNWANGTNEQVTQTIDFQGFNSFGCEGTASAEVSINPQPTANFNLSEEVGCAPLNVELTNNSILADAFTWSYGDGSSADHTSLDAHVYTFTGEDEATDYSISLTATHALGCTDTHEKTVTVLPAVIADWAGLTEGCAPFNGEFTYTGTPTPQISWSVDGATVAVSDAMSQNFPGSAGEDQSYTISVEAISADGCAGSSDFEVTVHPAPVVELAMSSDATCSGEEWSILHNAQFADSTSIEINGIGTWINPTMELIQNTVNATDTDEVTTVLLTAHTSFGCTTSAFVEHTVHPDVTAAFEAPESSCTPLQGAFTNNSVHASGSFAWNFGDGTTSDLESPVHTFDTQSSEDEAFVVTLIATSTAGCADTTAQTVAVWGAPTAELSINEIEGCYPVDVTFHNASEGNTITAWNYGNGETSLIQDSVHTKTFFNPTEELIVYTASITTENEHGCEATDAVTFEVGPYLNAQFDVVAQGCTPVEAGLINQSVGAAGFIWNFNDGSAPSNEEAPQHTFVNTTNEDVTYQVELIAMSAYGCADTVSVGVEVYPTPTADFSVSPSIQTYPNTTVGINNLSLGSNSAVQNWSFGDGDQIATDQPVFHTYNSWGSYNITVVVDNGFCADAHSEQITILSPHPVASFTGSGSGCAPLSVDFENHSNHGAQYIWDFGDDVMTSEESPSHVFTRPGVFHVSLTVIGYEGQEEQVIHYGAVEVFPSASAAFVNSPTQVVVPDQPVDFVNLSDMDATEFFWDFGDGNVSTEENPVHFYTEPGNYDVTLTANNSFNCPTTYSLEHAVEAIAGGFMEFPTAFTPNTGGSNGGYYDPAALDNDVFHPHHMGIVEYELIVFNKWGELLFRSTDPYIGWDGYFQGRIVRQDVYAWKAMATFSNGYRTTQAGDVTLIK